MQTPARDSALAAAPRSAYLPRPTPPTPAYTPAPVPEPEAAPRVPESEAAPRRHRGGPPGWALLVGTVAVLAICGAAIAVIVIRHSPSGHVTLSSNKTSAPSSSRSLPPPTTQPPSTLPASRQVAAQGLSGLLAQSASDRSSIVNAVNDVNTCGPNLAQDAQVFQQAADSRHQLLAKLAALPDSSALPPQMMQALTSAWQASDQADQDFAAWATDENSNGCTAADTSDTNYQAAATPDNQATTDKQGFVNLWNPIATQYGLPTYQWNAL